MSAAALDNDIAFESHLKGPLTLSAGIHLLVLAVAILGLPYLKPELPPVAEPVTVELVDVADIARARPPEKKSERRRPPQQTSEEPPRPVAPPQMTAEKPPEPVAPRSPTPEKKAENKPVPAAPDPVPLKALAPPPPPPLKRPVLTRDTEAAQEQEFQTLLRNLMPTEPETAQPAEDTEKDAPSSSLTGFSEQMSAGELDALKRQLGEMWSVTAGARYAEDILVDLKLFVNPNRTLRNVQVVDQLRYAADPHFRAAADSAVRAAWRASPLNLPPEKYKVWDVITVTFDPRSML